MTLIDETEQAGARPARPVPTDAERLAALRRMKRVATGLLAAART